MRSRSVLRARPGFVFGNNDCERVRRRARRVQANGGVRALTNETRLPFCPHNLVRGLFIVLLTSSENVVA